MSKLRRQINAYMSGLIDEEYGCFDAAAETISARLGNNTCKATISKRISLQLAWPLEDIIALEDAAGVFPVHQMIARRIRPERKKVGGSILHYAGLVAKETGEAVQCILATQAASGAGDNATAIAEIDEAIAALRAARALLEERD